MNKCTDIKNFGYCTKEADCVQCQGDGFHQELKLNVNAKQFVPKKKTINAKAPSDLNKVTNNIQEKLDLNLNAKEYVSKNNNNQAQDEDYDEEEDEEEIDMIMRDMIDDELMNEMDEESDEDKWFPKFKECECCKGYVYKCKGQACLNMGICYCKMQEECDDFY